ALRLGATEIIALSIDDPNTIPAGDNALVQFVTKLMRAVSLRQLALEMSLAEARGVPVHLIHLTGDHSTPIYDFSTHRELIEAGYEQTAAWVAGWAGEQG